MKPQTTNYDLFRISRYILLLGSCIASIPCGSGCNDFGLKNIATDEYDGDWEFYSFVNMDISGCFLCARWQSEERKTFELLFPCLPEDATGFINLTYFYSPSTTTMVNTVFIWQRFTDDECKSFNGVTSTISGGQSMYSSTEGVTHRPLIKIQLLPENSDALLILRMAAVYPEDTIFCIEGVDTDIPTVPIPTSATTSESSGPKESSPTEIVELPRTSKITQTQISEKTATISASSGPKESSPTEIIELPRTSKTTQTQTSEKTENNNGGTSLWIVIVAVVVILFLVLGFLGLLWYRPRRQKGGAAHPDKVDNNGTDVRGNQLVNHHGDVNDEMVYNGDPKYYSIEDGEVKIPTYALPDQEMLNNHDSYETVDQKATTQSKEALENYHLKNFQHTNKSFEQIDKNKGIVENANGKMVDEASLREDNEYSRKIFTEEKEAVVFCDRKPQYINYKLTGHNSN